MSKLDQQKASQWQVDQLIGKQLDPIFTVLKEQSPTFGKCVSANLKVEQYKKIKIEFDKFPLPSAKELAKSISEILGAHGAVTEALSKKIRLDIFMSQLKNAAELFDCDQTKLENLATQCEKNNKLPPSEKIAEILGINEQTAEEFKSKYFRERLGGNFVTALGILNAPEHQSTHDTIVKIIRLKNEILDPKLSDTERREKYKDLLNLFGKISSKTNVQTSLKSSYGVYLPKNNMGTIVDTIAGELNKSMPDSRAIESAAFTLMDPEIQKSTYEKNDSLVKYIEKRFSAADSRNKTKFITGYAPDLTILHYLGIQVHGNTVFKQAIEKLKNLSAKKLDYRKIFDEEKEKGSRLIFDFLLKVQNPANLHLMLKDDSLEMSILSVKENNITSADVLNDLINKLSTAHNLQKQRAEVYTENVIHAASVSLDQNTDTFVAPALTYAQLNSTITELQHLLLDGIGGNDAKVALKKNIEGLKLLRKEITQNNFPKKGNVASNMEILKNNFETILGKLHSMVLINKLKHDAVLTKLYPLCKKPHVIERELSAIVKEINKLLEKHDYQRIYTFLSKPSLLSKLKTTLKTTLKTVINEDLQKSLSEEHIKNVEVVFSSIATKSDHDKSNLEKMLLKNRIDNSWNDSFLKKLPFNATALKKIADDIENNYVSKATLELITPQKSNSTKDILKSAGAKLEKDAVSEKTPLTDTTSSQNYESTNRPMK